MASCRHAIVLSVLALTGMARAADAASPLAIPADRGGTFVAPPATVDPVYLPSGPDAAAAPAPEAPRKTSLRWSLDLPLRAAQRQSIGQGAQGSPPVSPTAQLTARYRPWPGRAWFAQATLYRYLRPDQQQPWNPDFSWGFGYDDWRPGTVSLTYGNYAGNRFQPDRQAGESRWNAPRGQWSLGYKFELAGAAASLFLVGDGDQATCSGNLNLTPRYTDLASGSERRHKTALSLGCRYTRPSGWYANATLFHYPRRDQRQPWDPDFTWGFGYFDWRPNTVSLQYNNYSGNRLPGRDAAPGQGRLRSGSVSVSWSTEW